MKMPKGKKETKVVEVVKTPMKQKGTGQALNENKDSFKLAMKYGFARIERQKALSKSFKTEF